MAVNINLTGFPLLDGMLGAMTHEMSEAITDTEPNWGWSAPPGTEFQNTELADVCEGTAGFLDGYTYTTAGGQPASFGTTYLATRYDFMAVTDWQLSGVCASQFVPSVSNVCRTSADCPAFPTNYVPAGCRNFQCQVPTCFDGLTDGDESDKDCGGSCPAMTNPTSAGYCSSGKHCRSGADCSSGVCTASACN